VIGSLLQAVGGASWHNAGCGRPQIQSKQACEATMHPAIGEQMQEMGVQHALQTYGYYLG
jgi:hypothetical protein